MQPTFTDLMNKALELHDVLMFTVLRAAAHNAFVTMFVDNNVFRTDAYEQGLDDYALASIQDCVEERMSQAEELRERLATVYNFHY